MTQWERWLHRCPACRAWPACYIAVCIDERGERQFPLCDGQGIAAWMAERPGGEDES